MIVFDILGVILLLIGGAFHLSGEWDYNRERYGTSKVLHTISSVLFAAAIILLIII